MNGNNRFVKTYSQNQLSRVMEIWVDKETGVNYIFHFTSNGSGGFTPLLDANGNVIVTDVSK